MPQICSESELQISQNEDQGQKSPEAIGNIINPLSAGLKKGNLGPLPSALCNRNIPQLPVLPRDSAQHKNTGAARHWWLSNIICIGDRLTLTWTYRYLCRIILYCFKNVHTFMNKSNSQLGLLLPLITQEFDFCWPWVLHFKANLKGLCSHYDSL